MWILPMNWRNCGRRRKRRSLNSHGRSQHFLITLITHQKSLVSWFQDYFFPESSKSFKLLSIHWRKNTQRDLFHPSVLTMMRSWTIATRLRILSMVIRISFAWGLTMSNLFVSYLFVASVFRFCGAIVLARWLCWTSSTHYRCWSEANQ